MPWSRTKISWRRVHVDFADPTNGVVYLALADSQFKWAEVISMPSKNTSTTISALDRIFTTHDFPDAVAFVAVQKNTANKELLIVSVCPILPTIKWPGRAICRHVPKGSAET